MTVTVTDDDTQAPALVFSPQQLSVDEGDTATYRLSLATRPTGAVTVAVSSGDSAALAVPVSFVFTTSNWNQPRTVTVRGVEDDDTNNETVTVTHDASSWWLRVGDGTVTVTVTGRHAGARWCSHGEPMRVTRRRTEFGDDRLCGDGGLLVNRGVGGAGEFRVPTSNWNSRVP